MLPIMTAQRLEITQRLQLLRTPGYRDNLGEETYRILVSPLRTTKLRLMFEHGEPTRIEGGSASIRPFRIRKTAGAKVDLTDSQMIPRNITSLGFDFLRGF